MLCKAFLPEVPVQVDASCCAGVTVESHMQALEGDEDSVRSTFYRRYRNEKRGYKKMDRKDILLNKQRIVIKVGNFHDHL